MGNASASFNAAMSALCSQASFLESVPEKQKLDRIKRDLILIGDRNALYREQAIESVLGYAQHNGFKILGSTLDGFVDLLEHSAINDVCRSPSFWLCLAQAGRVDGEDVGPCLREADKRIYYSDYSWYNDPAGKKRSDEEKWSELAGRPYPGNASPIHWFQITTKSKDTFVVNAASTDPFSNEDLRIELYEQTTQNRREAQGASLRFLYADNFKTSSSRRHAGDAVFVKDCCKVIFIRTSKILEKKIRNVQSKLYICFSELEALEKHWRMFDPDSFMLTRTPYSPQFFNSLERAPVFSGLRVAYDKFIL